MYDLNTDLKFKMRASMSYLLMQNARSKSEVLSATLKTYLENWLRDKLYNRTTEFSSKYTKKGNLVEIISIDRVNNLLNTFYSKNEESKENEFFTGTCDIKSIKIIDVKNSYTHSTFPIFDNSAKPEHESQVNVYMNLYNIYEGQVIYILENMPDELIEGELRKRDLECTEENYNLFIYNDLPDFQRVKIFDIEYNKLIIEQMQDKVLHCRNYIAELIKCDYISKIINFKNKQLCITH